MRRLSTSALIAAIVCEFSFAKSPALLRNELRGILPAGKRARLAWLQSGLPAGSGVTTDQTIRVFDSDSGAVRELTPPSLFPGGKRTLDNPSITFDGSRVVFSEGYTDTKYVINWNGTGLKSFKADGYLSRYWRDPATNTDWVTVHMYDISRYNIDNPSQRVQLWSLTDMTRPWFTLSPDGTRLGIAAGGQNVAIAQVPNGRLTLADTIGCRVNIAPDNSYDILFQLPYHRIARICDSTGRMKQDVIVTDSILSWATATNSFNACQTLHEYETVRWTNDRNYITFLMYCTTVNPFIMRLSDRTWIYVVDSLGCGFAGNMDMVVLDTGAAPRSAPMISAVPDYTCLVNKPSSRTVIVAASPPAALSATGLPPGLSVVNGAVPAGGFVISGTPTQKGRFAVAIQAANAAGIDRDTFVVTVGDSNRAPVVFAGNDTIARLGWKFYLSGSVTDDGYPNPQPYSIWTMISDTSRHATIVVPVSYNSQVVFADTGRYVFLVCASDGQLTSCDTVAVTVDSQIPSKVLFPTAGAILKADNTYTVAWQLDPPAAVLVELSIDNGRTYVDLTGGVAVQAGQTRYPWRVPASTPNAQQCLIQITDYLDRNRAIVSGLFTIAGGAGTLVPQPRTARGHAATWQFFSIDGRRLSPSSIARHRGAGVHGIVIRLRGGDRRASQAVLLP